MLGAGRCTRHSIVVLGGAPGIGSLCGGGLAGRCAGHAVAAPDVRPSVRGERRYLHRLLVVCERSACGGSTRVKGGGGQGGPWLYKAATGGPQPPGMGGVAPLVSGLRPRRPSAARSTVNGRVVATVV